MKNLKIRSSAVGKIITLDRSSQITEKQLEKLNQLIEKYKLTEKQAEEKAKLITKRDAPPALSQGAKTYVKELFFEKKSDFRKQFTNKFVEKGDLVESKSINEVCKLLKLPLVVKNEQHFENDWIKGTPDTIFKPLNFQLDIKSVYYPTGLDTFEDSLDSDYIWQGHSYDWLTGVDNAFVCKILLNPPAHILEKEVWIHAKQAGVDQPDDNFRAEVYDLFDFEKKMKLEDRVKMYHIETTEADIKHIKTCVDLSRSYYAELEEKWNSKNENEINIIKSLVKTAK